MGGNGSFESVAIPDGNGSPFWHGVSDGEAAAFHGYRQYKGR